MAIPEVVESESGSDIKRVKDDQKNVKGRSTVTRIQKERTVVSSLFPTEPEHAHTVS